MGPAWFPPMFLWGHKLREVKCFELYCLGQAAEAVFKPIYLDLKFMLITTWPLTGQRWFKCNKSWLRWHEFSLLWFHETRHSCTSRNQINSGSEPPLTWKMENSISGNAFFVGWEGQPAFHPKLYRRMASHRKHLEERHLCWWPALR